MYKILTDQNKLLGYAAQPNYIKVTPGGYVPCVPVEAVGLNFQGGSTTCWATVRLRAHHRLRQHGDGCRAESD